MKRQIINLGRYQIAPRRIHDGFGWTNRWSVCWRNGLAIHRNVRDLRTARRIVAELQAADAMTKENDDEGERRTE